MQGDDNPYRILILVIGLLFALGLGTLRFCGSFQLPTKPPAPSQSILNARSLTQELAASEAAYRSYLEKDRIAFGLSSLKIKEMSAPFPYQMQKIERTLKPGQSLEFAQLKISLQVEKVEDMHLSRDHMVLKIQNKTHKPIAYRVKTQPSIGTRSCRRMKQKPHNSVALKAGAMIERLECTYQKGMSLKIEEIETVTLPELGYYYLSSVAVEGMGLERRTMLGHHAPRSLAGCRAPTSAIMRRAIKSKKVPWRNLVDFYARHRCTTYKYPFSYRVFEKNEEYPLPFSGDDP